MKKIQLIVEGKLNQEEEKLIKKIARVKYRLPIINSYVIELDEDKMSDLEGIRGLKAVYENTKINAQMNTAIKNIKGDYAHENGYKGKNVTIAFLDTGISMVNDFLLPKNRIIAFKDFVNGRKNPYDDNGHGTHI